ncbi:glycosyltransferase family 4 protein [Lacinutrix iliipiscaria]|uniref:Glycosyltransferase family 4 protein n=1 Tax=Lacinutrix iliipiscaria TaxID=1230532 RepID=A0ABW5WN34_9FLAO
MNNKLKIAIYSGDIPSTIFIERLIKGISNTGNHVYLFGFLKRNVSYNKYVSVITYRNTKFSKAMHLLKYSSLLYLFKHKEKRALDEILKQQSQNALHHKVKCYPVLWHKPDVFHLQWAKGLKDWIWVKQFNIKLVLGLRGAHINYSPVADLQLANMYREHFPKVDVFHAVSKAIATEANQYNAPQDKIKVVYSGLDIKADLALDEKLDDVFQIISIGRPHWVKGYTYALDACKILKQNNLKFKYTIVGCDDDIELLYQIHDLNLKSEVTLLPQMSFEDVKQNIQSSDLLLLPSVKEGIANVVLEAMALGTMVLTTNCGGVREVITDGVDGFLTPIRDSKKMANKILEISNATQENKNLIVANAKKNIRKNHSEKQMVDNMLKLYKS